MILILTIIPVAGCKTNTPENIEKTDSSVFDSNATEPDTITETKPLYYAADYLPDITYGGYEFRVVTPPNGAYSMMSLEIEIEEETGDILFDAIYKRNRIIEEKYDIVFKGTVLGDVWACLGGFQKSVRAGSDDFDLCTLLPRDAWAQALEGTIVPVNRLPYLDITQPWYAHDVNSQISIGGKYFFVYSDECLNMFEGTSCVMFNKNLVKDLGFEDMYNLVKTNKWTVDQFFSYAKTATADLDGDGVMTEADRYGIVAIDSELFPPFWVASGNKNVSKDENDMHIFTGQNEKMYSILDKIYENLFTGQIIYFNGYDSKSKLFGNDPLQVSAMQFASGFGLFHVDGLKSIPLLRSMEADFGVLPIPKYDEKQEKYYSPSGRGWLNCAPVTTPDLQRTSIIMEILAVESKNYTLPAYIEIMLRTKYARDEESEEMLDIIYNGRTLDLGETFYWPVIGTMYEQTLHNKNNNFVSVVEKNLDKINNAIQKANETALSLD
ncbi:MAG: hypothetical protein FWD23_08810 [Oscillospiraceae bacterium]|nr:hypothetical protein [Oscillospiraceae bacterium]